MVNFNDYESDKRSLDWICLQLRVRPGQSTLAFYTAENNSSMPITGVSTYNVTPMKVLPPSKIVPYLSTSVVAPFFCFVSGGFISAVLLTEQFT